MKIFSRDQIYQADKFTIERQGITSYDLMERAGITVFNWIHSRMQGAQAKIHVFCGIGNNGGDGLVIGRHLITHGYNVDVYIVNYSENRSKDFLNNLDKIKDTKHWPVTINCIDDFPEIKQEDIVIDAIFGIGLNRNPDGCTADLMAYINNSNAFTLAIDIPSGLFMDRAPESSDLVIQANHVLSFQNPKLIFFLPDTGIFLNEWEVLDIGLDAEYLYKTDPKMYLVEKQDILSIYKPRKKFSHKGNYGHSLIIGGSHGKIGAAILASKACLQTGSGLVTSYIPECGYTAFQSSFPEAMVITTEETSHINTIQFEIEPSVVCIGMGMGTHIQTATAFEEFIAKNKNQLVIDADAINILAKNKRLLKNLPPKTVLTPHPGELKRLIGKWKDDFEKIKKVKALSKKHDLIIVIKGAHSAIVYRDALYINNTGNPGMATAGSGDVLAGMITAFIAQEYEVLTAVIFGVYLHGKAGDISVIKTAYQSLTASGIIDHIGTAFIDLFNQNEQIEKAQEKEQKK